MLTLREWYELDENKKDGKWATTIVTYLRQHMQPVISQAHAREGMSLLFGEQAMDQVTKMFKDPAKSGVNMMPLAILEKIRNIFIAEMKAMGVIITVRAADPTADEEKRHDEALIKNKKSIEGLLSYIYQSIGDPAFKMEEEEQATGKKLSKGNAADFDKMGLNPEDPEDVDFFMAHFHRLDHEIAAGDCIEYFMSFNEINELVSYWVNDILAKKAIAAKIYVSDDSGAIKIEYLAPESVSALEGRKKDYKDATCISYEQSVTISEMMGIIGSDFDPSVDMMDLLRAVNYAYKTEYTGVHSDGHMWYGSEGNMCAYNQFMQFKVSLGYIEWKSINARSYKVAESNTFGNFSLIAIPNTKEVTEDSIYRKESEYQQCTYKAYYLSYSPTNQHLYKFGKLNYQQFEGAEDQISSFSIMVYKEVGKSLVQLAQPFIMFIEKAFKKFEYMVVRAKPPGRAYNYESLVQIATKMFPTADQRVGVNEVMAMFYDSANEIYTLPEINGQPMGGGTNVNYDIPHGLSKSIVEFKNAIDWGFAQINSFIGISPLRDAYAPQPREAASLQQSANQYSEFATYYIPDMINGILNRLAVRTCFYAQDIISYKDKNTMAYKFLTRALGYITVEKLSTLGRVAMHRYGIFVESMDQSKEKAKFLLILDQALANKAISPAQYMLIKDIKQPKKAFLIFAYIENRNKKVAQAQAMALKQQEQQGAMQLEQMKQQTQQQKIQGEIQIENIKGEWYYKAHAYGVDIGLQKKQMELHDGPHVKADAAIRETMATNPASNIPAVNPMPVSTPAPTPAAVPAAPMQQPGAPEGMPMV